MPWQRPLNVRAQLRATFSVKNLLKGKGKGRTTASDTAHIHNRLSPQSQDTFALPSLLAVASHTSTPYTSQGSQIEDFLCELYTLVEDHLSDSNEQDETFVSRQITPNIFSADRLSELANCIHLGIGVEANLKRARFVALARKNAFTLAILIRSRCAMKDLIQFSRKLDSNPDLDDSLPWSVDECKREWRVLGNHFYESQSIFLPQILEEGACNTVEGACSRRPFLSRWSIGKGEFASVEAVEIAPGGWRPRGGNVNVRPYTVALKTHKGDDDAESKAFWKREVEFLDMTTRFPKPCNNIVRSLGYLEAKGQFSTFFEKAEMNLEVFLTTSSNEGMHMSDLIESAAGLCDGLNHLHSGYTHKDLQMRILHQDLRPANVLIFGDTWKLCDFGYSYVLKEDRRANIKILQHTRFGLRPMGGAYAPPELENSAAGEVFSIGTILMEVVASADGGPEGVDSFRKKRRTGLKRDQYWVRDAVDGLCITKNVKDWVEEIKQKERQCGRAGVKTKLLDFLVKEVMALDPKMRPDARTIAAKLRSMRDDLQKHNGPSNRPSMSESQRSFTAADVNDGSPQADDGRSETSTVLKMPGAYPRSPRESRFPIGVSAR